jgi:hypothetical protein
MSVAYLVNAKEIAVVKGRDASKQGDVNKPTMAPAYWAMDYYFDNLKKIVSSAPVRWHRIRRKAQKLCRRKHCGYPRFYKAID